jgi:hypothetical protein
VSGSGLQLRPEDFRQDWANALAMAMQEGHTLLAELEKQRASIERLAQFSVQALRAAEQRTDQHHQAMLHAAGDVQALIRDTGAEVCSEVRSVLEVVKRETSVLEEHRKVLDSQKTAIATAQRELVQARVAFEKAKHEYNNRGFWQRLFSRD